MLTLNRKQGQSIILSDDIKIMVTDIFIDRKGDLVAKIGVEAPDHTAINREEIFKQKVEKLDRLFLKHE